MNFYALQYALQDQPLPVLAIFPGFLVLVFQVFPGYLVLDSSLALNFLKHQITKGDIINDKICIVHEVRPPTPALSR